MASLGWQLRRRRGYDQKLSEWGLVGRLLAPLDAANVFMHRPDTALHRRSALDAAGLVLSRCAKEDAAYWGWPEEAWVRLIGQDRHAFARPWPDWVDQTARPYVAAYGYLLCGFDALHRLGSFNRLALAWRVFGREAMDHAQERIAAKLEGWGYRSARTDLFIRTFIAQLLLINRSARLEDLTDEVFQRLRDDPRLGQRRRPFHAVHRAIAGMGFASPPVAPTKGRQMPVQGAPAEWIACGRSLVRDIDPDTGGPARVPQHPGHGRAMACSVTARSRLADRLDARNLRRLDRTGDAHKHRRFRAAPGGPRRPPRTPSRAHDHGQLHDGDAHVLSRLPGVGLDARGASIPARALATPRSVRALIGPDPRVIADDVWAKLLWAGLNLERR